MIEYTTPTMKCTIPDETEFDYILITFKQYDNAIEKTIQKAEVVDNEFSVFLTQEETSSFSTGKPIQVQLNIISGGIRKATNIVEIKLTQNLHDEIIAEV